MNKYQDNEQYNNNNVLIKFDNVSFGIHQNHINNKNKTVKTGESPLSYLYSLKLIIKGGVSKVLFE